MIIITKLGIFASDELTCPLTPRNVWLATNSVDSTDMRALNEEILLGKLGGRMGRRIIDR